MAHADGTRCTARRVHGGKSHSRLERRFLVIGPAAGAASSHGESPWRVEMGSPANGRWAREVTSMVPFRAGAFRRIALAGRSERWFRAGGDRRSFQLVRS